MARNRHKDLLAELDAEASALDIGMLCNAPAAQIFGSGSMLATDRSGPEPATLVELAPTLQEVTFTREDIQGRQWICQPRRDLGILVSALTRTPALSYSMTGDAMVIAQLRSSGYAIHGEQLDESTATAAITYFPPGTRLPVRLPQVGPWYTMAVFGTIDAIEQQWGLGHAIAQALQHTPASLKACTEVVRKPWAVTQGATELLRDALTFRFGGVVARAYVEARAQQLICEVVAGLSETYRHRPLPARTRQLVQRARAIIANNPEQPHTLQSLSRSLGLNRTLLAEGFHAEFGETVFAFLQHERLRRAWNMLEISGERVASVAAKVGYRDAASFTRAFRSHYGVTPRHVGRTNAGRRSAP